MDWYRFWQSEPFGPTVQTATTANVSAVLANVNRDPKRRSEPFKWVDFTVPQTPTERSAMTPSSWQTTLHKAAAWAMQMGLRPQRTGDKQPTEPTT